MSIVGHGIDLIECARIAAIVERHRERFERRVLTEAEQATAGRFTDPIPHIAGRFAAKEAVLKLLGTGWRGRILWTDIEILNDPMGQPEVTLHGECARIASEKNISRILLSITHTQHYAAASAIGIESTGRE